MDKVNLFVGQNWRQEIPKALRASLLVLVCLSKNSVAKIGYVQHEFKLALETLQEMPEGVIHTLPVRLDACDVPKQFDDLQWCDLFEDDGFEQLVAGIHYGFEQRGESMPAPPDVKPPLPASFKELVARPGFDIW